MVVPCAALFVRISVSIILLEGREGEGEGEGEGECECEGEGEGEGEGMDFHSFTYFYPFASPSFCPAIFFPNFFQPPFPTLNIPNAHNVQWHWVY
jgi:hypothetical protein